MRKVCRIVLSSIASLAVLFSVFAPFLVFADTGEIVKRGDLWTYEFYSDSVFYAVVSNVNSTITEVPIYSGQAEFDFDMDFSVNWISYFPLGDAESYHNSRIYFYPIDLSGLPVGVTVTVNFLCSGSLVNISDWDDFETIMIYELPSEYDSYNVNDIRAEGGIPEGSTPCQTHVGYNAVGTATVISTTFVSSGSDVKNYFLRFLPYAGYVYNSVPLFTLSSLTFDFSTASGGDTSGGGGSDTSGGGGSGESSPIVEALSAALAGSPEQQAAIQERASDQEQKTQVFESYMEEMQVDPIGLSLPSVSFVEPEGGGDLIDFILSAPGFMLLLTTSCSCWVIGILLYGKRF